MRISDKIYIRNVALGGGSRILIQSMTNTDTADREKTLAQIKRLENCGCDIVRFTVNTFEAAKNIEYFIENTTVPLVADIHFDYRLAIEAAQAGISKIRINPGNIGDNEKVKAVAKVCNEKKIPIRVGINSGSLESKLLEKYGAPTAEALAESAILAASQLRECGLDSIVLSVKSSDVATMIKANRLLGERTSYPLHLGVTESGTPEKGIVKSAIGIGSLLADGIGDTIRVSLTADVEQEVAAAKNILDALKLRSGINLISCPTCGRTKIDLIPIADRLQKEINKIKTDKNINVALMGCVVNGPGEAREADVGCAGGDGEAVLFKKGKIIRKIPENEICDTLIAEIKEMICEN